MANVCAEARRLEGGVWPPRLAFQPLVYSKSLGQATAAVGPEQPRTAYLSSAAKSTCTVPILVLDCATMASATCHGVILKSNRSSAAARTPA